MERRMIILKCDCGEQYNVKRDQEIADNISHIKCNWCPLCMDTAEEEYVETHVRKYEKKPEADVNQSKIEL